MPKQARTKFKEPANATRGMTVAKRYVPNKALKKKNGYCLGTKSPAANKRGRSKFFSEKQRTQKEARRRKALKRMQ